MIEDKAYEAALDLLKQKDLIIAKMCKELDHAWNRDHSEHRYQNGGEFLKEPREKCPMRVCIGYKNLMTPDIEALMKEASELPEKMSCGHFVLPVHSFCPVCQELVSLRAVIEDMREFIKKGHHHDGCSRRYQPYPIRNSEIHCSCGRMRILATTPQPLKEEDTPNV